MIRKNSQTAGPLAGALLGLVLFAVMGDSALCAEKRNPLNGRQSYSGSTMSCLIANDFYAVHFTALQQGRQKGENTDFSKYCQEIPTLGKTFLTVDLLDRDVRTTPVALRVIEETISDDGRPPQEKSTLAEVPSRVYKSGSADTHVDITQPGHYALIVTVGEEGAITEDDRLRIPFSVALAAPTDVSKLYGRFASAISVLFFSVMGLIGFRTYRAYRPKKLRTEAEALEGRRVSS
jgi:hypothetical protein